jgi:hypothetical protein
VLVNGEEAEPVGFSAVGGGGVLLDAAEDVACHGCCSDREGHGGEEDQEEAEGARRSVWGSGESRRGNAHALAEECFAVCFGDPASNPGRAGGDGAGTL